MKKAIEDLFTKPRITKEDIEAFQDRYWEQLVPNFSQALKLLDIHGVPRHNILWSINDRLLEAIKMNVEVKSEDADQKKYQKLWQRLIKTGMVYIHHPYMRPLIMQVLGKMNSIKERHVNLIVDTPYLYDDAPLPLLRHIWVAHPNKFREELDKVISKFQSSWWDALLDPVSMSVSLTASSTADLIPMLYWPPRRRRRQDAIVRMVDMIGDGQVLYDKAVHILREECTRSEKTATNLSVSFSQPHESTEEHVKPPTKRRRRLNSSECSDDKLCISENQPAVRGTFVPSAFLPNQATVIATVLSTMRFDLLMSLNEAKIDRLCVPDRIHRFVWCLDACVRKRRIDERHISGLAYHLTIQRRRAKRTDVLVKEQPCESEGDASDVHEGTSRRGTGSARSKGPKLSIHSKKRSDDSRSTQGETIETENTTEFNLERDIHMACQDPWVLYTICTSLIRYTLNGLYENKLPRDISEINLLTHLLILGVGEQFYPPNELTDPVDKDPGSLKAGFEASVNSGSANLSFTTSISKTVVGYVLPAVAQLQVSAWRAQVSEEISSCSNNLWPGMGAPAAGIMTSNVPLSPGGSTTTARRASLNTLQDSRVACQPPPAVQKQIIEASQSTTVTVSPDYFAHHLGYLLLQYHALFALERSELAVLRALLKAAASATQQQVRASRRNNKTVITGSPPASSSTSASVQFRWRPDVLQALTLGIANLPPSAPAFVDSSRSSSRSMNAGSSSLVSGGSQADNMTANTDAVGSNTPLNSTDSMSTSVPNKPGAPTSHGGHFPEPQTSSSVSFITRAELASLLRASLALVNDLQLLVLAQLALLIPGPGPSSTTSGATSSLLPPTDSSPLDSPTPSSPTARERERLLATLTRHCAPPPTGSSETTQDTVAPSITPSAASSIYKSSDHRVLLALDALRRDVDKNMASTLPVTSTNFSGAKILNTPNHQFTPLLANAITGVQTTHSGSFQVPAQPPDSFSTRLAPRSPSSGVKANRVSAFLFPSPTRPEFRGCGNSSANSFYGNSGSTFRPQLPMGTPMTNPGLMSATPNPSNIGHGQSIGMVPPTPRRPSTPPHEFRPSSSRSSPFTMSNQSFGVDFSPSCPSPPTYRSTKPAEQQPCPRSRSPDT